MNLNYSCKVTLSPKWLLVALGGSFVDGPMNRAVRDWSHPTHIFLGAANKATAFLFQLSYHKHGSFLRSI